MANKKISDLTVQTTPQPTDLLEIEEVAVAASKKSTIAQAVAVCPASTTVVGAVELATVAEVTTGTSTTLVPSVAALKGKAHHLFKFVTNPQSVYAQRAQIVLMRAPYALTITRIHIACSDYSPTAELTGDLKWADDVNAGGFASAAVIDVCDTTNGVVTITSGFDDATVASGKYIYFSMDASPHADIVDFYIEIYYTED